MKTGILGGTFDPPHSGHLYMAQTAVRDLDLDVVLFVPCNRQPLKDRHPIASPLERASMTALSTALHPRFMVEHCELKRGGVSYTIDTLEELARRRPSDDLHLIIGSDSLHDFKRWKRYADILELAELIVIPRETGSKGENSGENPVAHRPLQCPELAVSSTLVRKLIGEGKPIVGLVSPLVEEYIHKRVLYLGEKTLGY